MPTRLEPALLAACTLVALCVAPPARPARAAPAPAARSSLGSVAGYSRLEDQARKEARAALEAIPCYHGCSASIASCLDARPRARVAWRLARYVVYLAGKKLKAAEIAKVLDLRRRSVHPEKRVAFPVEDAPRLGSDKAKLQIVELADFQCQHCAEASPILEQLVKRSRGAVALHFVVFPLRFKGPNLLAAQAALAAHRQGKFWPMSALLFANREQHTPQGVEALATKAGLDLERFRAALKDTALLRQLEKNKIEGLRLGVEGTPALYFNGKPHLLRKDEYHLRERIEEELELLAPATP